ncbi:unnamed protein product, partial [marine sediment metagenome]
YDVTRLGSLKARTQAATEVEEGAYIRLILQQLRRY